MTVRAELDPRLVPCLGGASGDAWRAVAALPVVVLLARSRTTETAVVLVPGFGRLVRKRWTWSAFSSRVKGAFRTTGPARSPARRESAALRRLHDLAGGPFAPEPLGVLEDRAGGLLRACTLLLAEAPGAVDLAHFLRDTPPGGERRAVLADLASRTAAMHAAGLLDREFHPRNVLVLPAERRTLKIDCAKQSRTRGGAVPVRRAAADLAALDVGFVRFASARERARFLRDYAGAAAARAARRALCARVTAIRSLIEPRESRRLPC